MGLLERLKAAREVREDGAGEEGVVDIRGAGGDGGQAAVTEPRDGVSEEAAPPPVWGSPSPCPACAEPGYLDRIDLVGRVMYQHCPSCRHRWEIHESETVKRSL